MDYKTYRWCAVPMCTNTSIKTPRKLFINVPTQSKMRKTWLKLSRRDPKLLSATSTLFFCEDHFDIENDMENYIQYKIMGTVKKVFMKPGCVPSKFACQPNPRKSMSTTDASKLAFVKRQRKAVIEEAVSKVKDDAAHVVLSRLKTSDLINVDQYSNDQPKLQNKLLANMSISFRSKGIQTSNTEVESKTVLPFKIAVSTNSMSPTRSTIVPEKLGFKEEKPENEVFSYSSSKVSLGPITSLEYKINPKSNLDEYKEEVEEKCLHRCFQYPLIKIKNEPQS